MATDIDPAALAMILQLGGGMAGKPGSQLSSADFTRYFSPQFGAMTGTYQDRSEPDEDIFARVAPNFTQIQNMGESEGFDPIAFAITNNIANGVPNIQTKKKLRELTSGLSKDEKEDYLDLFDELTKEYASVNKARSENKNKKTIFSEAGFDEPNTPYNPQLNQASYDYLANKYQPIAQPEGYTAGVAAKEKMANSLDAPYEYGGRPGFADIGQMGIDEAKKSLNQKIFGTQLGNPLTQIAAPVSYLGGILGGVAKNLMGVDLTKTQDRKDAYIKAKILQSMETPDEIKADAIMKKLKGPPIRTELVNSQRAEEALRTEQGAKELLARAMQRSGAGSPFLDQFKQRMLFTKIIENPGLLSKLKTPGS